MTTRTLAARRGAELAADMRAWVARELRAGRRGAGLSQDEVCSAAGMSRSQYGRMERGEVVHLRLEQAARAFAALGLRLTLHAYPHGDPVRDAGQRRVFERFSSSIPTGARVVREAPLPIPGDLRAWDARIDLAGRRAGVDVEVKLQDLQALERRLTLKLRDGDVDVLILVVADTPANRATLARHRESLRGLLPLDTRQVLAAFRQGRLPGANGICLV